MTENQYPQPNDSVRALLAERMMQHGRDLLDDLRLAELEIMDACGEYKWEAYLLVLALKAGLPASNGDKSIQAFLARAEKKGGLSPADARWAAEVWLAALDGVPDQPDMEAWKHPAAPRTSFSTRLDVTVYTRAAGSGGDWQVLGSGANTYELPEGMEIAVRMQNIGDDELEKLARDLEGCTALTYLNLAENRKITDEGLRALSKLTHLTALNLSSCSLNNPGFDNLIPLRKLEWLNLSFCNRISAGALRPLRKLTHLTYLSVQGCPKLTHADLVKFERPGLTIRYPQTSR